MGKINLSEKLKNIKTNLENSEDSFTKFAKIKKKAKENMEGNWNKAASTTFISLVLAAVTTFILLTLFGYCILKLGISYPLVEETQTATAVENTVANTLSTETQNTTSEIPIQQAPSDYYLTYSLLYILFLALIFLILYHLYHLLISTIYSIRHEEENLEFGTHFKNSAKNFKKYSKILGHKALKVLPPILLINFSYVTYIVGIYLTFLVNDNWLILVLASALISIIGFFLAISVLLNYTFTSFIVLKEPNMDVKSTLLKSKLIMYKNKRLFFDFVFSFIGWAILSVATLGIGFIWLIPYYQLSKYYLYEDLKSPENMKNKELKKDKKLKLKKEKNNQKISEKKSEKNNNKNNSNKKKKNKSKK